MTKEEIKTRTQKSYENTKYLQERFGLKSKEFERELCVWIELDNICKVLGIEY